MHGGVLEEVLARLFEHLGLIDLAPHPDLVHDPSASHLGD